MQKSLKFNLSLLSLLLTGGALLQSAPVQATDDWHWHGFVSQGVMQAKDSNFLNNDGDVSFALTEVGLNSVWQLDSDIRVAGQLMYLDGGNRFQPGLRIDYLFLNWTVLNTLDWQLDVTAGRFKNKHWLYSSTRDVALTRPMIVLPQSVYFDSFRDIAVGSDGLALQSTYSNSLGELELNWSLGSTQLPKEQSQRIISIFVTGASRQKFVHQLSTFFRPAGAKSQWGISLLDSDFSYRKSTADIFADGDFTVQRVMLNWRYNAEDWELSSEVFQERVSVYGFNAPGFQRTQFAQGAYLLGRYNVTEKTSLFISYDHYFSNKDDRDGSDLPLLSGGQVADYFGYQRDTGVALSHDLAKNWRVTLEYHWTTGTGRLGPNVVPDIQVNKSKHHQLWAAQLMYWF